MMQRKIPVWLIHIVVIAIFITYEVTMLYFSGSRAGFIDYAPYYVTAITYFYFNARFTMSLYKDGTKPLAVGVILVQIVVYACLISLIDYLLEIYHNNHQLVPEEIKKKERIYNIYRSIYLFGLSLTYWITKRYFNQKQQIAQLEIEKLKQEQKVMLAENAFLRAQGNPHTLFNAMAILQGRVESAPKQSIEMIQLISEIMQYAYMPPSADGKIPLESEIEQIERLIRLNELRYENESYIHWAVVFDPVQQLARIPPLILYPIVENIFKYGVTDDPHQAVTISLTCKNGRLQFYTRNFKRNRPVFKSLYSIGLKNIGGRLDYYYPGNFRWTIENTQTLFTSDLTFVL
eukprot:gene17057-20320_t